MERALQVVRSMKVVKALTAGALGSFFMFVLMQAAIIRGVAPFQVPPSAAALIRLGVEPQGLAVFLHFGYGMFWSLSLVASVDHRVRLHHALGLSLALWLVMMVVISPLIGWGFFGLSSAAAVDPRLALGDPVRYIVGTLLLHVVYGTVVGLLDARWIRWPSAPAGSKGSFRSYKRHPA